MGKAPCHDSGWRGAAEDTPSLDRVWPLGVVSLQAVVGAGPQARRAPGRGESPRVVAQTAAPALAYGLSVGAATWWPPFLPGGPRGPAVSQMQQPSLFPDHACAWQRPPRGPNGFADATHPSFVGNHPQSHGKNTVPVPQGSSLLLLPLLQHHGCRDWYWANAAQSAGSSSERELRRSLWRKDNTAGLAR